MKIGAESARWRSIRGLFVAAAVSFLGIGGFALAVTDAGLALSAQTSVVSVDRTHKSDRLTTSHNPVSTSAVTTLPRPPVGCESAFSRTADPARAHIFGRCIS
jgi:hypothetical protein